jgi:hypothetical protein
MNPWLTSKFKLGALALGLVGAACVHAGPGDWSGQGPFGGVIGNIVADPTLATRLYAATANGFFRSDDAGTSWTLAETGLLYGHSSNGTFAVSPYASGTLYLLDDAGRLYASSDGGANWLPTGYLLPASPTTTPVGVAAGLGSNVWLAANTGGLLFSSNSGATFAAAPVFPLGNTVTMVATNPHDTLPASQHILAGATTFCDGGTGACPIYVSTNGGAAWGSGSISGVVSSPGSTQHLFRVSYGPGSTVYALYGDPNVTGYYLIVSFDDGATWTAHPGAVGQSIAASPANASTVWLDASKSVNAGVSFAPAGTSGRTTNGTLVPQASAVAVSANYPATARVWLGTPFAGIYRSSDDGATWIADNDGITASNIRTLAVHPNDNTRLFAGFGDSLGDPSPAFYRSTTIGTWTASNTGLNAYQLRTVLIDPTTAGTVGTTVVYAVGSGYDTAPPSGNFRNSGIYKSLDGGLSWSTLSGGIPVFGSSGHFAGNLRTIIADPRSCDARGPTAPVCDAGPLQTLYVTGGGRSDSVTTAHPYRVMKSIDGGLNWSDSSAGLPADVEPGDFSSDRVDGVTPIVMDPSNSNILYIGTFASACDADCTNAVTPHVASGVYKSTNGGASWTLASTGLPTYAGSSAVYDTLSLAIDPNDPQTLWVSTISANFDIPGELYKTSDGGAHWFVSNAGINGPDVRALLVDPSTPGTLYAASGGLGPANPGGVYKSTDGGATWMSMSVGLPAFSALSLALDPVDSTVLYAGTSGGVYSIVQLPDDDADGVPDLIENSGPNGGDANHDDAQDSDQSTVGTTAPGLFGASGWQSGTANASQSAALQQLQAAVAGMNSTQAGIQGGYFTVQVDSGCGQAVDVSPVNPGPLGKDKVPHHGTYTYPRGLLRFELPECASADVTVLFNAATFGSGWSWRFYGPSTPGDNATMGWHDATSLVTSQAGNAWHIHLTKGQFGSYRPAGTGSILFEGGPAYAETIFSDTFD